ncbi:hypothetical protein L3X38_030152 [Prunus dulcis]|nr:hypothetical protein L3X38_030152 [Prunus dulcis]
MQSVGGTCDFDDTAMTTTVDPSYGSCKFTGSSNSSTIGGLTPAAIAPSSAVGGWSSNLQVSNLQYLIPAAFLVLLLL